LVIHEFEDSTFELSFVDTCGSTNYDQLKSNKFNDATMFLICYNSNDEQSYKTVGSKWIPEIVKNTTKQVEYLSLGLKFDAHKETKNQNLSEEKTFEWKISSKVRNKQDLILFLDSICEEISFRE
jgi:GTPase SAR1 family protein